MQHTDSDRPPGREGVMPQSSTTAELSVTAGCDLWIVATLVHPRRHISNSVHNLHVMQLQSNTLHLDLRLEVTERPAPEVRLVELLLATLSSQVEGHSWRLTQWTRTKPSSAPEAYALPWGWMARVLMGPLYR